jgi:hypothetical protein
MTKDGFWDKLKKSKIKCYETGCRKNHLHKKVNPETIREILRKNDFHLRKKAFINQKTQKVRMEFAENSLQRVRNSGKQFYLLTKTNIMYLDKTDVIVYGRNLGRNFWKKSSSTGQIRWWYHDGTMMVPWWCGYAWQHQEWKVLILSQPSWKHSSRTSESQSCKNFGFKNNLHFTMTIIQNILHIW